MTFSEYQHQAARTINTDLKPNEIEFHAILGMMSELGELAGIFQKEYQGHQVHWEDVVEELGDLLWFVAEFATINKYELDDIANLNIKKLKKRYSGEGFTAAESIRRVDHDAVQKERGEMR